MSGGTLSRTMVKSGSTLALKRVLPVPELLASLLPGAGLQCGSLIGISGPGSATLLLTLLAKPLIQGCWAAVVGLPDLGLEAAAAIGVELERLALVPDPGVGWMTSIALLLDALDLVAFRPPASCRPTEARRLAARARERGSILLIVGGHSLWPGRPDLEFMVRGDNWEGLSSGAGTLCRRSAQIVVCARRGDDRRRSLSCWLPGPDGCLSERQSRDGLMRENIVSEGEEAVA